MLGKLERKGDKGYRFFFKALKDEQDHYPHHDLWEKLIQAGKCTVGFVLGVRLLQMPPLP